MPLYRAFLQTLGAMAMLALALACHGKKGTDPATITTATITGTITYTRVPLAFDANGKPTGLVDSTVPANLTSLPARGVKVRAYQQVDQTQPDGSTTQVWMMVAETSTDTTTTAPGTYTLSSKILLKNRPTMVEILSSFPSSGADVINVVAEPINSGTAAVQRRLYALRKAADGTAPAGTNTPTSVLVGDTKVDFSVGLNDAWWVVNPELELGTLVPNIAKAVLETTLPGRSAGQGSGSRVLGIGDTIATFTTNYGAATSGSTLDLHYWPGQSEPKGTFIEYNRTLFPQAYDPSTGKYHFFGSIQAGPTNDDAWDEGVLLPLLARNALYSGLVGRTYSVPSNILFPPSAALTDLSPEMARIEGLADAMAANLLKSPYLADTQGTALAAPLKDIRDVSALTASQKTPYSAPALRALGWEIILKANSLPSPGTSANWATINPLAAARFFLTPSAALAGVVDPSTGTREMEPLNIFSQLSRLKEAKVSTEPVDLTAILTDPVITTLAAPFGITWPRPTSGTYGPFATNWGTDPIAAFPPVTLSMAKAVKVDMPVVNAGVVSYQPAFPNLSQGEIAYAGFSLTTDKRCKLTATITPALPSDGLVEVDFPSLSRTFSFTNTGGTTEVILLPVVGTAPVFHPIRIRMKSPGTQQADTTVTLALTPAP
ncbi:hypothetical protein [Geothrix sp. PMB-07]|uniref:hypothetical protein n=1 Tax=Geothrix sp. PMB-07 TaxID=3068640 RepID=UPI0027416983|nr:hypothetical protein [Geothrix sp. PMB-07]WLT31460.1 hypothetical protein Q9293_17255 [Geothrix sp. PMB-07]